MEYSHLFEDLENDSLDQFLAVAMTLLFEKVHHVACVGLMLHQHHRVNGFEDFDERRDVVGFEVMEISDFILHQFDTWVMQRQYLQSCLSFEPCCRSSERPLGYRRYALLREQH